MPTENEEFFTRERMQAIGLGIGRGLQSYDPDNPFAGAGAALEATVGAEVARDERKKSRKERLEDLKSIEDKQIAAEDRAEQREIRQEERQFAQARRQREEMLDWYRKMDVRSIDKGLRSRADPTRQKSFLQYALDFARAMIGDAKRIPGKPPVNVYIDMQEDPVDPYADQIGPAPEPFEPNESFDPYKSEIKPPSGNTPGSRQTYIDRNGVKRYKDNDKPFGMF